MKGGTSFLRVLCWKQDVSLVLHWKGPLYSPTRQMWAFCRPYTHTCFSSELQLHPGCLHTYVCFPSLGPMCKFRDYRLFFQSPFFFFFFSSYTLCHVAAHEINVFKFVCFRGVFSTPSRKASKSTGTFAGALFAVTTAPSCGDAAAPQAGPWAGIRRQPRRVAVPPEGSEAPFGALSREPPRAAPRATGAPRDRVLARVASERSIVQPERGSTDPNHRCCTAEMPCNPLLWIYILYSEYRLILLLPCSSFASQD